MRKGTAGLLVGLLLTTHIARAAFRPSMSFAEVQAELKAQLASGLSLNAIAKTAISTSIDAGRLTSAMLLSGIDGHATIGAVIGADGDALATAYYAACSAGVREDVARKAFVSAGADPFVVSSACASPLGAKEGLFTPSGNESSGARVGGGLGQRALSGRT